MMKNAFYFILKVIFIFQIFKVFSDLFGHVGKWLFSLKVYETIDWETDNYNTEVTQHLMK